MRNKLEQLDNKNTYQIKTDKHTYLVTLTRLKNTPSGTPRFEANVITMPEDEPHYYIDYYTRVYRFKGHYMDEVSECKELLRQIEEGKK